MVLANEALAPMQSAHLVGPYDWDEALMPRSDYEARLASLLDLAASLDLAGIIVHGNPRDHGMLAYVSGLIPRMGMPAWAFLAPGRAPHLGVAGLPTPRQSWIEDMRLVRDLKSEIGAWLSEIGAGKAARVGLCGAAVMTEAAHGRLAAALGSVALVDDRNGPLAEIRQVKSPRERALSQRASALLGEAVAAFATHRGEGVRAAAIAAKRAGYGGGAQDVVVLASHEESGTPLPLDGIDNPVIETALAWIGVRFAGYWAQGLVTIGARPSGAVVRADAALSALLAQMRVGTSANDLAAVADPLLAPYRHHPSTGGTVVSGIGLSLTEPPVLATGSGAVLVAGGVYSVRIGAAGAATDQGLASAMVELNEDGARVLWRSPAVSEGKR